MLETATPIDCCMPLSCCLSSHQFSKGAPSAEGNLLLSLSRAATSSVDSRQPNAPIHVQTHREYIRCNTHAQQHGLSNTQHQLLPSLEPVVAIGLWPIVATVGQPVC